ncbi:MAG: AAA family ATPase [Deltaproteobacteria bacterium]|nr:AAA family ATPase [Deltaproteobacteria bacterium]
MLRRHLQSLVLESLADFPVVLITGARQVGKSTLVQALITTKWPATYLTLDNRTVLDAALTDPEGFLAANPVPLIIDEIQRAPDLLRAIKRRVDRDRKSGQFLLTGSANLMTPSFEADTRRPVSRARRQAAGDGSTAIGKRTWSEISETSQISSTSRTLAGCWS